MNPAGKAGAAIFRNEAALVGSDPDSIHGVGNDLSRRTWRTARICGFTHENDLSTNGCWVQEGRVAKFTFVDYGMIGIFDVVLISPANGWDGDQKPD